MTDALTQAVRLADDEPTEEERGFCQRALNSDASEGDSQEPPEKEGAEGVLGKLRAYGEMKASRDDLIREAGSHQIEEARIARLMGHSRSTVRSVLGKR
ncbi:hypothetical protein AQJ67_10565 [Streptomyces caeruleatus]|uniref:Uncharacterized protein n=2 Tax=Streptomyces caeruleatus TaxID=661399 RepID=A0A101U5J3_9ACTN|nr:hypothetical protein AQJ67_10565 [Streptomyces caeruleatus]